MSREQFEETRPPANLTPVSNYVKIHASKNVARKNVCASENLVIIIADNKTLARTNAYVCWNLMRRKIILFSTTAFNDHRIKATRNRIIEHGKWDVAILLRMIASLSYPFCSKSWKHHSILIACGLTADFATDLPPKERCPRTITQLRRQAPCTRPKDTIE